ncbi:MAG TPA: hypothetical protein VF595_02665 [Tepidisphaeraceae bacterium]|jgi:hypothetical protein
MADGQRIGFKRALLIGAAALLGLTAATAVAQDVPEQPYVWKSVTVRAGGYIPGIVFSPAQKDLAYCRTDIGGPYKWDQPTKKWLPLLDWCGVYNYFGTESIAPDPVDPNKVYIASGMYGRGQASIMRSADGGKTFKITEVPFAMGGNENGRGLGERLAVDPNDTSVLYFGSRHDGLWQSTDAAVTWKKVDNFPAQMNGRGTGGLGFVLFNRASGKPGTRSREIFVGNSERASPGLFRSSDAGATWEAVPGQPAAPLFPSHADMDTNGVIYFSYTNSIPPGGATDGAIWTFDTRSGTWADITPIKPNANGEAAFGYGAVSVDRQRPGTAICSTIQRDTKPGGDDLLRTTDGGRTWKSVSQTPNLQRDRDVSMMPYLKTLANPPQWFGWWMTGIAIDPFDSNHVCYTTGATIYNTQNITEMDAGRPSHWNTWVDGIEETANIYLLSPREGPPLYSGFGDIGGFTHDDLDAPPAGQFENPEVGNTQGMEYAAMNPKIVVRNGVTNNVPGARYGYSEDFGKTWQEVIPPPPPTPPAATRPATQPGQRAVGGQGNRRPQPGFGEGTAALIVSADGVTLLSLVGPAHYSRDRGQTWTPVNGLPPSSRVVADRVDASKFYSFDLAAKQVYTSTDGGLTFTAAPAVGLPDGPWNGLHLWQGIDRSGDIWLVGGSTLLHSLDGGRSFKPIENAPTVAANGRAFGLGKAAPGKDYPAVFVGGTLNGVTGMFRSDDSGATWVRVNDDRHQYGLGFMCLTADPRLYGRVYVGFNGRGIVYGDIAK